MKRALLIAVCVITGALALGAQSVPNPIVTGPIPMTVALGNPSHNHPFEGTASRGFAAEALFDLSWPLTGPFPSDWFTVPDPTHNTGLRVKLPKPNCVDRPSDCDDLDVINQLDGFNVYPRLSVPFSGPIDLNTVAGGVFLIRLGSTLAGGEPGGQVVGIDQVVFDPSSNTLYI